MDWYEDHQESERSRLSQRSDGKSSQSPLRSEKNGKDERLAGDHTQSGLREPAGDTERDRRSDGERSSASFYSDDYENASDRSLSPPASPSPHRRGRSRRVASSPLNRAGVRKGVSRRLPPHSHHPQQRSVGVRSQSLSKKAPSKEMDPVTKRMLSARLLKINELKNALSELRLHADELQRENRLMRQLQHRQEKALHRYNDTESEISQLISRHNNETHVLRERLRRSQESQRATVRSLRDTDTQLQRCRNQLQKLQQLADHQNLGEREELSRKLIYTQDKLHESDRRVKELEKNMELSTGSFQRQLANERRRTNDAQQEVTALQEEVEKLCTKLKEKERELDARNIYANRMVKPSSRKEAENASKRKGFNTTSTKAVQTEDRTSSLDFPSPPPALTNELPPEELNDDYLSLKQDKQGGEQRPRESKEWKIQEFWREREKERDVESGMEQNREKERETEVLRDRKRETELLKNTETQKLQQQPNSNEKNSKRNRGLDKENEDWRVGLSVSQEEESRKQREQEEQVKVKNLEIQASNQERAEEERHRKEQLLAKMHEIDMQTQGQDSDFFSDDTGSVRSPPRLSEQRNHNGIFKFTEPEESTNTLVSGRRGALRAQAPSDDLDLAFGSYAPSFGRSAPRGTRSTHHQPRELDEGLDLGGLVKERKSNLMQQLFGATPPPSDPSGKMEILSPPLTAQFTSGPANGRRRDTDVSNGLNISSVTNSRGTLQVSESRPAVRAIASFDDDIEEVTL